MEDHQQLYELARLLVQRLERISVDSIWSHRSSGHRGALLRWIEHMESLECQEELQPEETVQLNALVETGFRLLELAAEEKLR